MDERSRDELEAENATLRAVLEYILAKNDECIRELVAKQARLQEALAAYDAAAGRAVADLHAMIQAMWAWEHRERQRYGEKGRKVKDPAELVAEYEAIKGEAGARKTIAAKYGIALNSVTRLLRESKKRET